MAVHKGGQRKHGVSLKALHSILPSLPDPAIRRIQKGLASVVEMARSEFSAEQVRANAQPLTWVQGECRTLSSALKEAERVLETTPEFILNTVFAVTFGENPRFHIRWVAGLRALGLAAEELGKPLNPKGGSPPDYRGLAVALGVFTVLAEEGVVAQGPSRGVANPWTHLTTLMLSQLKGMPVQRVDRHVRNAAQLLKEGDYLTPRPGRTRKAAPRRTKAEYQKWKKLDSQLEAVGDSTSERTEAIAKRFNVTIEEVRRARKRRRL